MAKEASGEDSAICICYCYVRSTLRCRQRYRRAGRYGSASQGGGSGSLTRDCAAMEAGNALQQARAREACPSGQGSLSPNDVVYGNCGEFTFWLFNGGDGFATFYLDVYSYLGPVTGGYWTGDWHNWDEEYYGWTEGYFTPVGDGWEAKSEELAATSPGYVTAVVVGDSASQVYLADDTVCDLNFNSDYVTVS